MIAVLRLGLWALGCASAPSTVADCARIADLQQREECRFTLASALLDQPGQLDQALADIDSVESRDLLLLRLAVADPPRASRLCAQVTTTGARQKCRQVVGRPHLSTSPRAAQ
ncbi:MAG: hypothetical protein GXP62_14420 [Oligoflexia bacterium]|nr:hypothetical protein [Oligoflexia bacterium]